MDECFVGWAVSKNVQIRVRPAYPCICYLFLSRYSTDTYRRRIRGVSVSGAYQTRDTCPECRVRVTEVGAGVIKRFVSIYSFYISFSEDFTTQTCTPILEVPFIFMLEAIHFTVHACFSAFSIFFWFNRACVEKMDTVMETMRASELGSLFVLGGLS